MLDASMMVLTKRGYRRVADVAGDPLRDKTISNPAIRRRPYRGKVIYLYTDQGDHPFICTPDHRLLVKSRGERARWCKAADVTRGVYVGTLVPDIFDGFTPQMTDHRSLLEQQLGCIASGVCRAVRTSDLDAESSRSDTHLDDRFCWFKVHDLETSVESGFMFHTSACIANNVCSVD